MNKKMGLIKLISIAGAGLGLLATLVSNYAMEKETEVIIEEKVNEALSKRDNKEES